MALFEALHTGVMKIYWSCWSRGEKKSRGFVACDCNAGFPSVSPFFLSLPATGSLALDGQYCEIWLGCSGQSDCQLASCYAFQFISFRLHLFMSLSELPHQWERIPGEKTWRNMTKHADSPSPTCAPSLLSPLELFSPVNSLNSKQVGEILSRYIQ